MGIFSQISERLSHVFSKLSGRGKLTSLEIKEAMREIKIALLEADVNFLIVKKLIAEISEEALGEKVLESLTPGQHVVKIVNEKLTALMGSTNQKLNISSKPPTVIMMCGLQGAGKTTMCGKLAFSLKKQGKKVLLVAADIYRPAAIEQLEIVGKKADVAVLNLGQIDPVKIAREAIKKAEKEFFDIVIIDTAGRLHINEELMMELKNIKKEVSPHEILLTVDAMTGQDATTVADSFNKALDVTGIVLTKLDGDTRGGAALAMKEITGKPIKFCGIGEKIGDLEPFFPERMASRILGMGDVLTLIEKAQAAVSEDEMAKMEAKLRKNSFTLEDYLVQMETMKSMGGINDIIKMIPGSQFKNVGTVDEEALLKNKAIIQSMTRQERNNPDIIKASRRQRIAKGSATTVQDVNRLLKQFEAGKDMMKKMKGNKFPGGKMPF